RHQLGATFIPVIDLSFLIWLVPESPWLLKKQRYRESFAAFCRLRNSPLQSVRDFYYTHAQLVAEEKAFARTTYLMVPRLQCAMLASFIDIATTQKFRSVKSDVYVYRSRTIVHFYYYPHP
ncbi:hypothetical protein C8R44DRAFT_607764, partial [Mycena epipterygia]